MTKKFSLILIFFVVGFLLAGCSGQGAPAPKDDNTFLVGQENSDTPLLADQGTPLIGPRQQDQMAGEAKNDDTSCQAENTRLSDALEMNTDALKACESERKNLVAKAQGNGSDGRYQEFVDFYVANNKLTEFPFPKCGPVNTFSGEAWFAGFKTALEAAALPLGNATVQPFNLSGGCASQEGKMAFFLGAQNEETTAFHLLKYDFQSGKLEPVLQAGAPCSTVCPDQLGKRVGPYLTLFGSQDGSTVEYHYYYADNFLVPKP